MMNISAFFPMWDKLTQNQKDKITDNSLKRTIPQKTIIHNGSFECTGLVLVISGQLRSYIVSDEGREITLYRLFERDMCLFSASCMMSSIQFEVMVESEKDSEIYIIPAEIYKDIIEESAPLSNYTNEIMASHFSDVMWLIDQIMWKSLDKRLAAFLLNELSIEGNELLKITHEEIGNHMGTAREVVTRMLRYFQGEGIVQLSRGSINITNKRKLIAIVDY